MNRIIHIALASGLVAAGGLAMAAAAGNGITMSTDPAKIAAIEQHAKELQARDHKAQSVKASQAHGTKKSASHHKQAKHHTAAAPKTKK
jgi:hypothetical protein